MDFTKLFEDLAIKADNLEKAMKILPHKNTLYSDDIKELDNDVKDIQDLELAVRYFTINQVINAN